MLGMVERKKNKKFVQFAQKKFENLLKIVAYYKKVCYNKVTLKKGGKKNVSIKTQNSGRRASS